MTATEVIENEEQTPEATELVVAEETSALAPATEDAATGMISIIAKAAADPNCDIEKMKALLDMKKELDAQEAEKEFAAAFSAMREEIPRVVATRKNEQTSSMYAKIEDINKTVDPVLSKHGFSTRFQINQTETHVSATCVLQHRQGHSDKSTVTLPLDNAGIAGKVNKTAVHAIGSSISYAKRYAKCAVLDISVGDDDGNAAAPIELITADQADNIEVLLDETGTDREKFFQWVKVDSVQNIPAANYEKIVKALEEKKA